MGFIRRGTKRGDDDVLGELQWVRTSTSAKLVSAARMPAVGPGAPPQKEVTLGGIDYLTTWLAAG